MRAVCLLVDVSCCAVLSVRFGCCLFGVVVVRCAVFVVCSLRCVGVCLLLFVGRCSMMAAWFSL